MALVMEIALRLLDDFPSETRIASIIGASVLLLLFVGVVVSLS